MSAEVIHRLHFAFTIIYHYLFPQLTMGLALIIVILKWRALRTNNPLWDRAARFWVKIFAVNFAFGVVTGIPLEFQFGTNWARFSKAAGGVVGQTLALEGTYAFFLESTLLGLFLFGEGRMSKRAHFVVALLLALGTWLSGYFIVATNAWMQHPVGYTISPDGRFELESLWALLSNPWAPWQYLHTMLGAVVTGSFFVAGVGAWYLLSGNHVEHAKQYVRIGVLVGLPAALLVAFPTGDVQARNVAKYQPITFAAMEGHFESGPHAGLVIIGQPDMDALELDNAITMPGFLSFLTHNRWDAEIQGLKEFPREQWPDNIPLLYYAYHMMVGLGTLFIGLLALCAWRLRGGRLYTTRWLLWILLLSIPLPFIANTVGWMTAELGRQPWVIHGLMRTDQGYSLNVSSGNALFTFIGFAGLYVVLSILWLFLMGRRIALGPDEGTPLAPIEDH